MSVKVSIVIPTFNRKESLKKTLESLFNQTYPKDKYEIIVCDDDKSTDGTEGMVKELMKNSPCKIRYFKVKNKYKGPTAARNVGIENANGEVIGFTDDDCVASPNWIENAVSFFDNETITGVQGCTLPLPPSSKKNKIFWIEHTNKITEQDDWYATCNIFYRKKALIEVRGFDHRFFPWEDTDLAWSLLEKGYKIVFSKDVLVYHETKYISFPKYLKKLKKQELFALFVKKHPIYRKKLMLRFISSKKNLYPIPILFAAISYLIGSYFLFYLLILTAIMLYLWARVVVDANFKMYPLRILAFIRYILIDFISLFYTVKGAIRYRCFII